MINIAAVEEVSYRQSRLCRFLGNPVAFLVVALLAESKEMSTVEIAKAIGRSVPRTSNILGALRLAELVRYETEGRHARYGLKHPRDVRKILKEKPHIGAPGAVITNGQKKSISKGIAGSDRHNLSISRQKIA